MEFDSRLRELIERLVNVVATLSEDVQQATTVINELVAQSQAQQAKITSLEAELAAAGSSVSAADQAALEAATAAGAAAVTPAVAALTFAPASLSLPVGQPASGNVGTVSGGTPPYTVTAAGLPSGLTADAAGNLAGTPDTAGTYSVTVSVSDSSVPVQTTTGTVSVSVA